MEIIVGTAGHIDHGKTALVRALTGTDADRLPEEKRRGITIDIGFASLDVGDVHFGFVDVPGHERFVKNMLAGASGIDIVILVVAADEGVMPQTREHFDICRLLGVSQGVVALTKCDLVDSETLALARLEAAELASGSFLDGAPMIPVSVVSGRGLKQLKEELVQAARRVPSRNADRATFLPIDRSFTLKGFGAVVTGTLASGEIVEGTELELLPGRQKVRVRGLQTHERAVTRARAGQRTAVNLGGIDHAEVMRGMVLTEPGLLLPAHVIDAELEMLPEAPGPLRSRQRVRLHIGTSEVLARLAVLNTDGSLAPGEKGFVQFRCESPVICRIGDRFIIRRYSPQQTIGGGRVLMPLSAKVRKKDLSGRLEVLSAVTAASDPLEMVNILTESAGTKGIKKDEIKALTGWRPETVKLAVRQSLEARRSVEREDLLVGISVLETVGSQCLATIERFHRDEPLAAGMPREKLKGGAFRHLPEEVFAGALARLEEAGSVITEKGVVKLSGHKADMPPAEQAALESLRSAFRKAGLSPPKIAEVIESSAEGIAPETANKLIQILTRTGEIRKVSDEFYFSAESIDSLRESLRQAADKLPDRVIDVSGFKAVAGVSRKYAIPLLEYFDRERVTARAGDKRVVLK
ncbi:MAG TPA: selenocysteine-specific translation elongation factor [Pyrinomonadaceae bacterium]|nr:selenocysteine-specific translation elongation factor [Pyrinomonadaceae bacterium]